MKINLKYFASVREAMGQGSEVLHTQATSLAALRDELIARGGAGGAALGRQHPVRMAIDHNMVDESVALTEHCEVAFFPPVTGG
jgi:sulfur-carrier protein